MCTAYISIQSDCVFIVRTTRGSGTESVVNIINLLRKVIVHHVQRRLLGYEQTRSKLSLSPFSDPWSHPSSREPPERLEFSSALPFLFFRVYLLSPNSFPAPPSRTLPAATHSHYHPQLCARTSTCAPVHFINVTFDGIN